jgi:hypothetical protein
VPKKPATPATPPAAPVHPLAALVDEIGALEAALAPHKPQYTRLDKLRKDLREQYAAADATMAIDIEGAEYQARLGPCGIETVVSIPKLLKLIGGKLFQKIATVSLKAIEEHCLAGTKGAVTSLEQIGPRGLKVWKKAA